MLQKKTTTKTSNKRQMMRLMELIFPDRQGNPKHCNLTEFFVIKTFLIVLRGTSMKPNL